jgi:hypothetical protein
MRPEVCDAVVLAPTNVRDGGSRADLWLEVVVVRTLQGTQGPA